MSSFKVFIEITDILEEGNCPLGHVIGETFLYPEDRGKICATAFNSIYPYINYNRLIQKTNYLSSFKKLEFKLLIRILDFFKNCMSK